MKKIKIFSFLFFVAIIGVVFSGCSSDSDDCSEDDSSINLVGTWVYYEGDNMYAFQFLSNGTCTYYEKWNNEELSLEIDYSLKGDKLSLRFPSDSKPTTYVISDYKNKKMIELIDDNGKHITLLYDKDWQLPWDDE